MDEKCTIRDTIEIIGKKWSLLVILSIHENRENKKQFSNIKSDLKGITGKVLSRRLKELAQEKIISKEIDRSTAPLNTYYSLTKSGKKLIQIINSIKKWGLEFKFDNDECKATFCKNCRN